MKPQFLNISGEERAYQHVKRLFPSSPLPSAVTTPTMNTATITPTSFFNSLVATVLGQKSCTQSEAETIVAKSNPLLATLARAFGKPKASVNFFNLRHPVETNGQSRAANREAFAALVKQEQEQSRCNYGVAFNRVAKARPDLVGNSPSQFANASTGGVAPIFGPGQKATFRLPQSTPQNVCEVAWAGNGNTGAPFNPGAVFDALCTYLQEQNGLEGESAIQAAKQQFQELWRAVEQLAAQPA